MFDRLRHLIANNQILIVLLALVLGILFPSFFLPLAAFSTPMLMAIFFTSSLRLELNELWSYAKDWKMLSSANIVKLFVIPLLMWIPLHYFAPDWALAFLIVGVVPTGLTIALIADLFGGKTSLAMLISATTSLLAPLTVPFVFWLLLRQQIAIPVVSLFESLFLTIVVPFLVAMLIKAKAKKTIQKYDLWWREISLVLFGLLVAGITADSVKGATITLGWNELGIIIVMLIFMGGAAWLAYAIAAWRKPSERVTIALCMVYMNNTLALYIGDQFFHGQNVVPKLLIILTAVNALLIPIKWAATKALAKERKMGKKPREAQAVF
ncbi:MAG: bile acid:sodium symporter [Patescibacteria group bacterium]